MVKTGAEVVMVALRVVKVTGGSVLVVGSVAGRDEAGAGVAGVAG